jgi:hypothetical protein
MHQNLPAPTQEVFAASNCCAKASITNALRRTALKNQMVLVFPSKVQFRDV